MVYLEHGLQVADFSPSWEAALAADLLANSRTAAPALCIPPRLRGADSASAGYHMETCPTVLRKLFHMKVALGVGS